MKKPKFRRFGISAGTKVQQMNLRSLAKEMANDPGMLIPACGGKCSRCQFDKLLSRLRKVQAYRDKPDALKKLATKGKQLERGYASMLLLATEKSPIMFATAKLPTGDVTYTVRGKVNKETLIGLQHFDDPRLRLLAYSEMALKKRLHIYSLADGLVCSGSGPGYPPELIKEVLKSSAYYLKKGQDCFSCEHSGDMSSFRVDIISAGQGIELCKSCTSRKHNLLAELNSRVMAKHPEADFDITVDHGVECTKDADRCSFSESQQGGSDIIQRYRSGEISDMELIEEYAAAVRSSMERSGKPIYLLGAACYEDDMESFIDALSPTEIERIALRHILKNEPGPVIMDNATPNSVLSMFWDRMGASAINSVIGDKELAREIFSRTKDSGKTPSQVLRDAKIQSKSKTALAALPELGNLSRVGKYLDDIARTYKALGREETLKRMASVQDETKMKSINCGVLITLGALKGKEWQFTKEELDYGKYLADFAGALLESAPEGYETALQNFLTASGSEETVG